jgi:Sap, sulfolipid-1-addressing protein
MEYQLFPLAITMMAGPQIMSAIIFVTHPSPIRISFAFLIGVTTAMVVGTTIFYFVGSAIDLGDPSDKGSTGTIIQLVLVALLVLLAVREFRHRENVEPPKWLGGLLEASTLKALLIGLTLVAVMPTDIVSMLTVGVNLQQNDSSLWGALPFWLLTLLIAASPLLVYLLFRKRAQVAMPKVRDWMGTHSWLVNIIVIGIFIFLILS